MGSEMDSNNNPVRVLVIDDEATIRHSFTDYLEDQGFEVLTAEDGRIGLELIKQEQPQVILVDLRMPELNGLEVLQRCSEFTPDTPKIVISGANSIGDVVRALRYGAWDYLVKPVTDLSILNHTVLKALEKARLLQENRRYQKHLEELVLERTQELEQANSHLSNINTRLRKIVETTQGLAGCVGMNHFGSQILDEFAHHMVATGGSLYFVEEDGLRRIHSLDPGHAPDFIQYPLPQHSILRQVIEKGKPLLIDNVLKTDTIEPSGWTGYDNGSLLAFPIPDTFGRTVGVLTLHSKKEPPFVEQDKEIGAILASYSCETLRAVQAFEALKKSERQYRTLFEKTNDAIFIVEKITGRYLDANEAAAELTGRTLKELKRLTTNEVPAMRVDKSPLDLTAAHETMEMGIVNYCRPDNTNRIARLSTVSLDDNAVIGIARDITHDLEIEKQLRQSQKMEAIGTLAGGIAHDFNNILSGIFGFAQLAKMDLDSPEKLAKHIDQIVKGAQRATGLVQQILMFSRQTENTQKPLKLYLIVKEAIKFLRSSIPSTIEIKENLISQKTIMVDSTQLHQVVINLCTNAYHAIGDSVGTLTVGLDDIDIPEQEQESKNIHPPGSYVKLEIRDTGHGMDKETLEKIFNPYFTTKQLGEGTGLGLAVVTGIIKKHNGFIKAFSEPGKGSTFQIFLPVINKNSSNTPTKKQQVLSRGTENIMVVDDEINILHTTQSLLEKQGYKVTIHRDGLSAFKAFENDPHLFDLVITDMAMPNMSGDNLAAKLIKIRPDIPIFLCTGFSANMSPKKAASLNIREFLLKPVIMMDLVEKIRKTFDGKKRAKI